MRRGERIYQYIREQSTKYTKAQLKGTVGLDAQEIAAALDILRNNVSKELNELHRQGRIVKFSGRPVRYFDRDALETLLASGADNPVPWYGQLMTTPQTIAWFVQLNYWLQKYKVELV